MGEFIEWPFSREQEVEQAWHCFKGLKSALAAIEKQYGEVYWSAAVVAFPELLNELIALNRYCQLYSLKNSSDISWESRIGRAVKDQITPAMRPCVLALARSADKVSMLRYLKRKAGGFFYFPEFKRALLQNALKDNVIIALASGGLLRKHAQFYNEDVYLFSQAEWFVFDEALLHNTPNDQGEIDEIAKIILGNCQYDFPDYVEAYLLDFTRRLISLCSWHLIRIEKENMAPSRLWAGSANNLETRLIRMACARKGGWITLHDHGEGIGCFYTDEDMPGRLDLVHEYVCFNEFQANCLRSRPEQFDLAAYPILQKITSFPFQEQQDFYVEHKDREKFKKILYALTISPGDQLSLNC